jgi:hypothetical protein
MKRYGYFLIAFTIALNLGAAAFAMEDYERLEQASSGDVAFFAQDAQGPSSAGENKNDVQALREQKMSDLSTEIKSMMNDSRAGRMGETVVRENVDMTTVAAVAFSRVGGGDSGQNNGNGP